MKGSEFDREVLAKKPNADLKNTTLKDRDFLKTEGQIWIHPSIAEGIYYFVNFLVLINSLVDDANFFRTVGLIDYSLLVFKINWAKIRIFLKKKFEKN